MEIIYKSTKNKSNFKYCSEIFKNKQILNGFNRLGYCPVDSNIIECGDVKFENTINGIIYLSYPLSVVIKENIKFNSLHSLIKEIRRVYHNIYKDYEASIKYGIWGHDISELCIEGIVIYSDYSVDVNIGS